MEPSIPDWYDSLQEKPFRQGGFTAKLAAAVHERASSDKFRRNSRRGRLFLGAGAGALVLGILLVVVIAQQEAGNVGALNARHAAEAGSVGGSGNTSLHEITDSITSPVQGNELGIKFGPSILSGDSTTDQEWEQLINNPWPDTQANTAQVPADHKTFLGKEAMNNEYVIVFSKSGGVKKDGETQGGTLYLDYFKQTDEGWKKEQMLGYSPSISSPEDRAKDLETAWGGLSDMKVLWGFITNDKVKQIRIINSGEAKQAQIIPSEDGRTYWFSVDNRGKSDQNEHVSDKSSKVEALDADGQVLSEKDYVWP